MTMSDRGQHPDLIDEQEEAPQPVEEAPQRTRGPRGSRRASPTPVSQSEASPPDGDDSRATEGDQAGVPSETPEWFSQVRDAKDPTEALRSILKNVPYDELEKDEVFSGLVGRVGDRRAREMLKQQERDAQERAKLEAAQNNDLYTLGEMTQRELQEQQAARQAANQNLAASGWAWDGIVKFQQSQPEELQKKVAGKTFGEGKGQAEGYAEYLQFWVDEGIKLGVERELKRNESAYRKSVLSEVNGDEPVPERENGTPGRVREVTDEQIAAMDLTEYNALFDENNRPKPGVRHRSTRGIPLTQR